MSDFEQLNWYISQLEEVREINEYKDLINEFNSLKTMVEGKKEITEEEDKEFSRIIKRYWKRIIAERYTIIKNKIENKKTKGQNFSGDLRQIDKIRCKSEDDLRINEYYDLYVSLTEVEKDVDEKISNECHQKSQSWKMLLISYVLGVATALIIKYFIK